MFWLIKHSTEEAGANFGESSPLLSIPKVFTIHLQKCVIVISNNEQTIPFAVRNNDCLPAPSKEFTLEMLGGISLSSIGPIRLQICNKWSGATCLLDST